VQHDDDDIGNKKKKRSNPACITGRDEARLLDFLQHLSANYGKNPGTTSSGTTTTKTGYDNTGKRAIPRRDYASKLQGKALTLVGGGFHKAAAVGGRPNKPNQTTTSRRWNPFPRKRAAAPPPPVSPERGRPPSQRPRTDDQDDKKRSNNTNQATNDKEWIQNDTNDTADSTATTTMTTTTNPSLHSSNDATSSVNNNGDPKKMVPLFLNQLQGQFNAYATRLLLRRGGKNNNNNNNNTGAGQCQPFTLHRPAVCRVEWVGARIRIRACPSHRSYVGRHGIVIAVTQGTWCVVFLSSSMPPSKDDDGDDNNDPWTLTQSQFVSSSSKKNTLWKPKYVPKRGTVVSVLLPIPHSATQQQQQQQQMLATTRENNDTFASRRNPPCVAVTLDLDGT